METLLPGEIVCYKSMDVDFCGSYLFLEKATNGNIQAYHLMWYKVKIRKSMGLSSFRRIIESEKVSYIGSYCSAEAIENGWKFLFKIRKRKEVD